MTTTPPPPHARVEVSPVDGGAPGTGSTRLTLDAVNALSAADFAARFGPLFEHSPWVAQETWPQRPFASRDDLHAKACAVVRAAGPERQLALVRAHPDLAGRLARQGQLTADSAREQAHAGLDRLTPAEAARFAEANAHYRRKFGFPFVICARLADKETILRAFAERLPHTPAEEMATALTEIEKIAALRLAALVAS